MSNVKTETVVSIEELPATDDWVYDITMENTSRPYFFANGLLVHNSTYFLTHAESVEEAIKIGNGVAELINRSYPQFMRDTFLCNEGYDNIIKCGREVVSDNGIFVNKKRYILHLVDLDGKTVDKMKVMGLDTKKTTLPRHVSETLNEFIERHLKGESWTSVANAVVAYKKTLYNYTNIHDLGLPKSVNNIDQYLRSFMQDYNTRLPGGVAAAIHYNQMLDEYNDKASPRVNSGMKIKVFRLKTPRGRFTTIALPTDIETIPDWFTDHFESDVNLNEHIERLVDNPIGNILEAISKKPPSEQTLLIDEFFEF